MSGEGRIFIGLGVASIAGVALYLLGYEWIATILYLLGISLLTIVALYELIHDRHLTVELLMAIVGIILILHGVVFEGLIIYVLYAIAETMEVQVKKLALRRIEKAKSLIPRKVTLLRNGSSIEASLEEVRVGDKILVRRGEVVPVDGVLLGEGVFDTSMVTGESLPTRLDKGEAVESGYINVGDPVVVVAVKPPSESTLQVLVDNAMKLLENKSRVQRLIERLSPYMIVSVLAVFAVTYIFAQEKAVAVLLAGCPSAYIIDSAATTSYVIGLLAGRGVVVRGGAALETASKVGAVVIDKTGTLTMGIPKPLHVHLEDGDEEAFKKYVSSAASTSLHPVSKALARNWEGGYEIEAAKEYPGRGLEASVSGRKVYIGSREFIEAKAGKPSVEGCGDADMVVYAAVDGSKGAICLAENVDEDVSQALRELERDGLKLFIASGDRVERVEKVAERLGIRNYLGGLKPRDKTELVERLREETGNPVSMVGDGVNDLEALASSDFGVAIGNIDAVSSVSDAVLLHGFKDMPVLLKKARAYKTALIAGFIVATVIKTATIVLGLTGAIPLWMVALLGDDGSTLLSTLTSILVIHLYR